MSTRRLSEQVADEQPILGTFEPSDSTTATHQREMIGDLQRLVEALDRRVPRLEHACEPKIAKEAAALRQQAVTLMSALRSELPEAT